MTIKISPQGPQPQQGYGQLPEEQAESMLLNGIISSFEMGATGMDYVYLTPEAMLAHVEQQLHEKDQAILSHMQNVEAKKKIAETLSTLGAEVTAIAEGIGNLPAGALQGGTIVVSGGFCEKKEFPNTPEGKKEADEYFAKLKAEYDEAKKNNSSYIPQMPSKVEVGATPEQQAKAQAVVDKCNDLAEKAEAAGLDNLAQEYRQLAKKIENGEPVTKEQLTELAKKCETFATSLTSSAEMTMIKMQQLMQDRSRLLTFVSNALKAMDEPADTAVRNMV